MVSFFFRSESLHTQPCKEDDLYVNMPPRMDGWMAGVVHIVLHETTT